LNRKDLGKSTLILGIFNGKNDYNASVKELLEDLWKYQEEEASIMVEIATLQYENGDTEDAIDFLEKSVSIYHDLAFTEDEANILDLIGDIYFNMNDIPNALTHYRQSFNLCLNIDTPLKEEVLTKIKKCEDDFNKNGDSSSLESVTQIFDESSPPEENIDYAKIGKKLDDIIGLLDESSVYGTYQNFENPLVHVKEAYELSSNIGDEKGQAALLLIMGDLSLKKEKTQISMEYFRKSLNLFRKLGDKHGEAISILMIGTAYFLLGETEEGSSHLRQSMEIIKGLDDEEIEKAAIALLNSIYE
jgi:tetratricopeptide (TPR) repeat protein